MRVNRKRLREIVTVTLECEEEDTRFDVGQFDDETVVDWIREQLQMGNQWAWCTARVTVAYKGLEGEDWLGACSYASEADFRVGGYYDDMISDAVNELAEKIEAIAGTHGLFEIENSLCLQCIVA